MSTLHSGSGWYPGPNEGCCGPASDCHHGDGVASTFTQVLGPNPFTLTLTADGKCSGTCGAKKKKKKALFQATGTLRVVTHFSGTVTEIWGIGDTTESVQVTLPDPAASNWLLAPLSISLAPNAEWAVAMGNGKGKGPSAAVIRKTPFYPPI